MSQTYDSLRDWRNSNFGILEGDGEQGDKTAKILEEYYSLPKEEQEKYIKNYQIEEME